MRSSSSRSATPALSVEERATTCSPGPSARAAALPLAVSGDQDDALRIESAGFSAPRPCRPSTATLPARSRVHRTAARASSSNPEPARPVTPTTSPAKRSRSSRGPAAPVGRGGQQRRPVVATAALPGHVLVPRAEDQLDEVITRERRPSPGAGERAVAEHRDPVGDLEDLVEVVRDQQHGIARSRSRRSSRTAAPPRGAGGTPSARPGRGSDRRVGPPGHAPASPRHGPRRPSHVAPGLSVSIAASGSTSISNRSSRVRDAVALAGPANPRGPRPARGVECDVSTTEVGDETEVLVHETQPWSRSPRDRTARSCGR